MANFTIAKRQEILQKKSLQQTFLGSSLSKDKLYQSVSLDQLHKEVNKAPPVVMVNVLDSDRNSNAYITHINKPSYSHRPNVSSSAFSHRMKRSDISRPKISGEKKSKCVKSKK